MNEKIPRTPFSTHLSGSAKEAERRIRNIFVSRKRPPVPLVLLVCALCLLSGNLVSCQMAQPSEPDGPPQTEMWLNFGDEPETMPWDDGLETQLPEYPGVTFRWTPYTVSAEADGQSTALYSGMPVWSVFLCDITGDGLRELCSVTSYGSGMIDDHIVAYDYAAKQAYLLWGRGVFDYGLSLEDGQLRVSRSRYMGAPLSTGSLAIEEDVIRIDNEVRYGSLALVDEVLVPTDAPDLAWLLMRENDNYPYAAGDMQSQLLLAHEEEGCTLALALVDSGPHIAGNGNLMLGLWDQAAQGWSGPIYTVGGDVGEFSSWTDEEGALHVLCANTMIYQGDEGPYNVGHYRFDGKTLTELGQWYDELDRKLVPAEGGLEVYEINPQYRLQQYNPEYNGVPLPEKWLYSHFEPVT